eukprot:TRINITY_DN56530_c0_g1_i1.p1 TRINITY_DN56530_c0_g1~~TRINITY_DN56530_c0_g1_i1.p1  ORF type:complete len:539 (-),score=91.03 TRINITY_DN56530_c0_g1_i1:65-1600(-)
MPMQLLGGSANGASGASTGGWVSEKDVRREREHWTQTCLHEVWKFENAAFERIQSQVNEAVSQARASLEHDLNLKLEGLVADAVRRELDKHRTTVSATTTPAGVRAEVGRGDPVGSEHTEVSGLRRDVAGLAKELADERFERCTVLSDVGRLTESVARAAAQAIEHSRRSQVDAADGEALAERLSRLENQQLGLRLGALEADLRRFLNHGEKIRAAAGPPSYTSGLGELDVTISTSQQPLSGRGTQGVTSADTSLQASLQELVASLGLGSAMKAPHGPQQRQASANGTRSSLDGSWRSPQQQQQLQQHEQQRHSEQHALLDSTADAEENGVGPAAPRLLAAARARSSNQLREQRRSGGSTIGSGRAAAPAGSSASSAAAQSRAASSTPAVPGLVPSAARVVSPGTDTPTAARASGALSQLRAREAVGAATGGPGRPLGGGVGLLGGSPGVQRRQLPTDCGAASVGSKPAAIPQFASLAGRPGLTSLSSRDGMPVSAPSARLPLAQPIRREH